MDTKCMASSSNLITPKIKHITDAKIVPKWTVIHRRKNRVCPKFRIKKYIWGCQWQQKGKPWRTQKICVTKEGESLMHVKEDEPAKGDGKKGTIAGVVALIVGTSIWITDTYTPTKGLSCCSDLARLRASVLIGSPVPLLALLVWDAIALGLSAQAGQILDPVELLRVKRGGVSFMEEAFSLLAVGTSMIGTLLGFWEFFEEQLKNLSGNSSLIQITQPTPDHLQQEPDKTPGLTKWWGRNKTNFTAMTMVITPTLLVSTTVPHAFSTATDIAGANCITVLYGILPPAMAWAIQNRGVEVSDKNA